ncbi:MAG: oligosaccharyl transferase, archaeosortase A system-associated, partial [Methanoregulaceae archaeon]|nr:oligosaccharyl transferase, archaeosortase A system-associated [Methanoregulaceae archaeon]
MKETRTILVAAILLVLFVAVLYIRALPLINLGTTDILNIVGSDDPLYNLRQIELVLENYPHYAWFEAMTLFPTGQTVPWGPLFTWIGTTMVMISGAATRSEIIGVALWLPPILAALMVPVMFVLGRKVWNWKAGLIAAALIAVVGGQFFFRSLAGYLDHHVAEVLFSTLYVIAYIYAISNARNTSLDFRNFETLKIPLLLSGIAGIAYVLGFLVMPTMILFAFITSITTILLFVIDFFHKKPAEYIVFVNTVIFGIAAIISLFFSFISGGFGLTGYTLAHPVSYLLVVIGTIILYILSKYFKGKNPFL